jgi:predicted nucleic acid-binding protein
MFILDTNVVSELRKTRRGKGDKRVEQWSDSVEVADLFLSAVTILELEIGVLLAERKDPTQGAVLRTWLNSHVLVAFEGRIIPVDATIAQRCAKLHIPNPPPLRDSIIAATALVHGMTVVTRNVQDFSKSGINIINPWEALKSDNH